MGGRTLSAAPDVRDGTGRGDAETGTDTAPDSNRSNTDNPGLRLLDALRAGDDLGVLAVCGSTTTVSAENMNWSCLGREQIQEMLVEARDRFPGLTFEPRTRHVGFGLVIEEARVRDVEPEADPDAIGSADEAGDTDERSDHPMYDNPSVVASTSRALTLWHDPGGDEPPAPLNMPVRVTVQHDDLMVHDVAFSFPAALLKRAFGLRVDPFELSLSEVQSAFVAPAAAELVTRTLSGSEPVAEPSARDASPDLAVDDGRLPHRRRRWLPVVLVVLALAAAGAWWALQGGGRQADASASIAPTALPSTPVASTRPSPSPSAQASAAQAPTVTHAKPAETPSRPPNVTLRSDLAFGFNSATLSAEAETAIDTVARQVLRTGLHGKIYVDGYTDSTGSASYGDVLSQQRADAVSTYLQSRLLGAPVSIVSSGHGEAHPVADNATAAGRKANRRVTITLPRS